MSTASVDTIAKLLDMTSRRVQQLANEGIIPKPKARGQYEIVPCVVGYVRHLKGMLNGEGGDLAAEKTRLTRAQADKTEIEIARLKKDLISANEAEESWAALIGAFRSKMMTLPMVAVQLAHKSEQEIEETLTQVTLEALTELSNWSPSDEPIEDNTDPGSTDGSPSSEREN